jgi:hypothetical protein
MKRATRYRIAKLNRASTELRYAVLGVVRTCWYELRYPGQMAAARQLIEADRKASTLEA